MCVRHLSVCTLLIFANCSKIAQGSGTLVGDLVQHWQKSKDLALVIAKAMPEELYSRTAPGQEYTSASQLNGIALTNVLACTMALHTRAPERFQSAFDKPMDPSKAGVIENLNEAYSYCVDGLKSMADADVLQMAAYKGRRATKFDILECLCAFDVYAGASIDVHAFATIDAPRRWTELRFLANFHNCQATCRSIYRITGNPDIGGSSATSRS